MKSKVFLFLATMLLLSCGKSEPKLIDDNGKNFYINGVSVAEGKDAIVKSLKSIGFKEEATEDISILGEANYSTFLSADKLTEEQYTRLTGGIFCNLPTGINYYEKVSRPYVRLEWFTGGMVTMALVSVGENATMNDKDALEVNKRLENLFPHSKITNTRFGCRTYYNDNGVGIYYGGGLALQLTKK